MTWNKKNQQFARSCGLRPSTKDLAPYLLRRADKFKPTEVILDLREWNREIGKDRPKGEYDRKTAKEALAQLNESTYGWFTIMKSYTWAVHKVLVRPVQYAINQKSPNLVKSPKPTTVNPMFTSDRKKRVAEQQQQDMSTLRDLFSKLGMHYTDDAIARLWRMAGKKVSEVKNAVEFMLKSHAEHKQGGIPKPHGWLHNCLKNGWHHLAQHQTVNLPFLNDLGIAKLLSGQLADDQIGYARSLSSDRWRECQT